MNYSSDASGHIEVATLASDGTAFVPFAPQPRHQLTIVNKTGLDIEVQQDGAGDAFPILSGSPFVFCGITSGSAHRSGQHGDCAGALGSLSDLFAPRVPTHARVGSADHCGARPSNARACVRYRIKTGKHMLVLSLTALTQSRCGMFGRIFGLDGRLGGIAELRLELLCCPHRPSRGTAPHDREYPRRNDRF
jgi:hypothetical protein